MGVRRTIRNWASSVFLFCLAIVVGLILRRNAREQKKVLSKSRRPNKTPYLPFE